MSFDHVVDTLDFINEHKVYRYLYLVAVSYVWIKFKATLLYGKLAIWIFRKSLYSHVLFEHIEKMTVTIPTQIRNMGKKHAFNDFIRLESALFVAFLQTIIINMCKVDASMLEIKIPDFIIKFLSLERDKVRPPYLIRYIHEFILYMKDFDYSTESLPIEMISGYDQFLKELPDILEPGFSDKIEVRYSEIIRMAKKTLGKTKLSPEEERFIREAIQEKNIRILIAKYNRIMYPYRVQIKKNLELQITSELNIFEQVKAILKYSFQSVYSAMQETLPLPVNELNGELNGVVYSSFECGEK